MSATTEGHLECTADGDCPGNATCQDGVCVDAYGTPLSGESDLIGGGAGDPVPVRFHPQGAGIDLGLRRTAAGEDVQRSPVIEGPGTLASTLSEGDTISLASISEGYDDYFAMEARAVIEVYGPQHARPTKTLIETESV